MKKLHLVYNAHIDPVWLWQWEEGAAETLSTFRVAAEFCEAPLFTRIQALVKQGSWPIMGGWYLQQD